MYSEENVDDSTSLNCYVVLDIVDDIHRESSTMELSNFYFYVVVRTKSEFPAQSPFISSVHFWLTGSVFLGLGMQLLFYDICSSIEM